MWEEVKRSVICVDKKMVFFFLWLVILERVGIRNLVIGGEAMIFFDDGEDEEENKEAWRLHWLWFFFTPIYYKIF